MQKCSKYNAEYRMNENHCQKSNPGKEDANIRSGDDWIHLTTVSNDIEFSIITGMLEIGKIPTLRKLLMGEEIIGLTTSGIEVMVPKKRYREALQLLDAQIDDEFFGEQEQK